MTCNNVLLAVAAAVLCVAGGASALPIAPSKDWCKTSATGAAKREYALFPSGKCALCSVVFPGPNHCYEFIGQVCSQGPPYEISKKNGWKYCLCGSGWYGAPAADDGKPATPMSQDAAGCAICPFFGTTSMKGSTTAAQCNICRISLQFSGKGPFCNWDPTKFAFPNCSIPKPWQTYAARLPGKGGCGCSAGSFGSWPDCRPCPPGLTTTAGNGKKCTCNNKAGFLPTPESSIKCTCDTKNGFYPTFQNTTTCVKCSTITGSKVVKGKCGCDNAKGYGISLSASSICLKCSSAGAFLHKASGECRCSAGKGVHAGSYGPPYCVKCDGKNEIVVDGICKCAEGFAISNLIPYVCIPCTGDNKRPILLPGHFQPICGCDKGYESIYSETDGVCTKCGAGATAFDSKVASGKVYTEYCTCIDPHAIMDGGRDCNACATGYVKSSKTGKCQLSAACKASKWTIKFWTGVKLGNWNGTFFPNEVIDKKVKPTKATTLKSLSVSLDSASIPGSGKFAAVLEIWLWGKKGAPNWLKQGQGRYTSNYALVSLAGASKVINLEGFSAPNYYPSGWEIGYDLTASSLDNAATQWDSCKPVRIYWWGTKKADCKLVAKLVRRQGGQGWF